jgi:hypothetical protein
MIRVTRASDGGAESTAKAQAVATTDARSSVDRLRDMKTSPVGLLDAIKSEEARRIHAVCF